MADEELVVKVTNPVIVDLGGVRSKRIGQLKQGKGPLMDEVMETVDDVSVSLGPEVKDKMAGIGVEVANVSPSQFHEILLKDTAKFTKLIAELGIKPE